MLAPGTRPEYVPPIFATMDSQTLFLLLIFNALVWSIVLDRLIKLARGTSPRIALLFGIGMLFQALHSVLLPFSAWFSSIISVKLVNTAEVSCAVVSSFFLYVTALNIERYGKNQHRLDPQQKAHPVNVVSGHLRPFSFGVIAVLIVLFIVDLGIAGDINNSLTPSSTGIWPSLPLLFSRVVSHGYIVVTEIAAIRAFYALRVTHYGSNHSIRLYAAIAALLIHTAHFVANLFTTIVRFALVTYPTIGSMSLDLYLTLDTYILIPLGLAMLVAVGPSGLIDQIERSYTLAFFWRVRPRLAWLRQQLVDLNPSVALPETSPRPTHWYQLQHVRFELTRYAIECSDAFHQLSANSRRSPDTDTRSPWESVAQDAKIVEAVIQQKKASMTIPPALEQQVARLGLFRARTLRDLIRYYSALSSEVAHLRVSSAQATNA